MAKRTAKLGNITKKITKSSNTTKNNGSMKMTMCTAPTMLPRAQPKERRPGRPSGKKLSVPRNYTGKARSMARRSLDPCDNSNDSGLGFDNHMDHHMASINERMNWTDERTPSKRPKLEQLHVDIKLENDEINDNYSFPEHSQIYRDNTNLIRTAPTTPLSALSVSNAQATSSGRVGGRCSNLVTKTSLSGPITLTTQLQATSRYVDISLSIICQPEQQHRARYQTEGSRGAVKDRSGNGFPVVQLKGYNKPTTLQVFIGTDMGKVSPHMFYQACRVSGKNSTPCSEKKIDGTIIIELQLDPTKEMTATCDCVGILKERNVDVEHRFPDQLSSRSKKKSTKCRMVFRTTITHNDGTQETLQVCSQPIVCTQPPGVPEISKKSLTSCPASGGLELFIIGKNFLKDTSVYFQLDDDLHTRWEQSVTPDKEYLQQTHLVCVVPPYMHPDITEPVTVRLYVVSSGKSSEPHQFVYTPVNGAMPSVHVEQPRAVPFLSKMLWSTMTKQEQDVGMMPPPGTSLVPLSQRRSSTNLLSSNEVHSPPMRSLKQELLDENSQNSVLDSSELTTSRYRHISESSLDVNQGDSNISMINDNSIDLLRHNSIMHSNINDNSNLSIVTENSIDIMRTTVNEENRCNNFSPQNVLTQNEIDNLKVIDLRMKMPMATVADLVDTNAPSMATLQSLGVTENNNVPLPAQSAQSVETYLTNIESKAPQVIQQRIGDVIEVSLLKGSTNLHDTAYLSNQAPSLTNNASEVGKNEAVAIVESSTQVSQAIESRILSNPITNDKLDALVNCAVTSHINAQKEVILSPQDIILNSPIAPILTTSINSPQLDNGAINTTNNGNISPEVILNTQIPPTLICGANPQENLLTPNNIPNICHTNSNVDTTITSQMLSNTNASSLGLVVTEPEKAIILNAAADLLETQKKLNLPSTLSDGNTAIISDILTTANSDMVSNLRPLPNTGNNFYANNNSPVLEENLLSTKNNKSEFVLNVPLKDIVVVADKKTEDRMIPPAFTTMSENDLINIINPSCFDQV